jgi:outer membrane biosynthesis protein TonB
MALLHLRRLLALLAVIFTRSFEAKLPNGARVYVWPRDRVVLPVMSGGAEGDPDPDPKDPKDPDPKDPKDPADPKDPDPKDPDPKDPEPVDPADDWKVKSRKNETRAKKAERELQEERKKREQREETEKSETQKAIDKAKKEGRTEAETEAQKERKADRLEVAVTRLASKKITLGSGDDAEDARFADTEDAQLHIERAIARGEIDEEDIFDKEGRVNSDALQKELVDLLERKPHLKDRAPEGDTKKKPADPDTRKVSPVDSDLEKLTPEDHAKRKYGAGK